MPIASTGFKPAPAPCGDTFRTKNTTGRFGTGRQKCLEGKEPLYAHDRRPFDETAEILLRDEG